MTDAASIPTERMELNGAVIVPIPAANETSVERFRAFGMKLTSTSKHEADIDVENGLLTADPRARREDFKLIQRIGEVR
ncbi:MAG TPA: hypothetical protein VHU90_06730 [Galbitalea sp.]|nr:hypothetical protein [Galbitalea sp.]